MRLISGGKYHIKVTIRSLKEFNPNGPSKVGLAKITFRSIQIEVAMLLFEANTTDMQLMGKLRYLST